MPPFKLPSSTLLLCALAGAVPCLSASDAAAPEPQAAAQLYAAAVNANTKEVSRTYSAYQKALADATAKVVKALEANIKDLNDPKKLSKLDLKERVAAIESLEQRILDVQNGALEREMQAQRDLLGDGAASDGMTLILWNQSNGTLRDRGAKEIKVLLFVGSRLVREMGPAQMPWTRSSDDRFPMPLPRGIVFDRVRVEISSWHGVGGGLSEIQVLQRGKNIIAGWRASASASYDRRFEPDRICDGIATSAKSGQGYWLLPNGTAGWIELTSPTAEQPDTGFMRGHAK